MEIVKQSANWGSEQGAQSSKILPRRPTQWQSIRHQDERRVKVAEIINKQFKLAMSS